MAGGSTDERAGDATGDRRGDRTGDRTGDDPVGGPALRARIGVDVGGTFTDIVLATDDGRVVIAKATTTPADPGEAVTAGIVAALQEAAMPPASVAEIVHGTTVASNTILQKQGARTGLLTTAGFADVLEIGRIRTPDMFDLAWSKPQPLVPRRWRLEVAERIAADGSIVTPLDDAGVLDAAERFRAAGVAAIAVCFINSYLNPAHERRAAALLRAALPGVAVCASCEVLPEPKEYERTSTAAVNAYILPAMRSYLSRLSGRLAAIGIQAPLQVMASNGGTMGLAAAAERPVFAVGSGPAGGVTGGALLARALGVPAMVVFDMGGTTAKASIVEDAAPALVSEYEFREGISTPSRFIKGAGYMLKVPAIDIAEVGAGGGSIAAIDAGGLLRVGPMSAGGDPGPACYGRGNDRPTVTDANMVLGLLNPHALAGGSLKVDAGRAADAIRRHVAGPMRLSLAEAAFGIRAVANAAMARAIRAVTVERGRDPRDLVLMACGGGGPTHAADVARALGMRRIIVTPVSGVFSAAGMLAADTVHDLVHPVLAPLAGIEGAAVEAIRDGLAAAGRALLAAEGHAGDRVRLDFSADLRLVGQASELSVPLPRGAFDRDRLRAAFLDLYEATFGYRPDEPLEVAALRLSAVGTGGVRLDLARLGLAAHALAGSSGSRAVHFARGEAPLPTPVAPRAALGAVPVRGPAIFESYDTTIVVPPDAVARADASGAVLIDLADSA